ncbi:MAG: hypothetical protein J6Y02_18580 [Pseudobutyrivibrio sp.]|nr:hypothetical protein [Pseudobutyrivibrio sp.]
MLDDEQKQLIQKGAMAGSATITALLLFVLTLILGLCSGKVDTQGQWLEEWKNGSFNGGAGIVIVGCVFLFLAIISFAIYNNFKNSPELEFIPNMMLDENINLMKVAKENYLKRINGIIIVLFVLIYFLNFYFLNYKSRDDRLNHLCAMLWQETSEDVLNIYKFYYYYEDIDEDQLLEKLESVYVEDDEKISEDVRQSIAFEIEEKCKAAGFAVSNSLREKPNLDYPIHVCISNSEDELCYVMADVEVFLGKISPSGVTLSYEFDQHLSEEENIKNANEAFSKLEPVMQFLVAEKYIDTKYVMNYLSIPEEFIQNYHKNLGDYESSTYIVPITETLAVDYDKVTYTMLKYLNSDDIGGITITFYGCFDKQYGN